MLRLDSGQEKAAADHSIRCIVSAFKHVLHQTSSMRSGMIYPGKQRCLQWSPQPSRSAPRPFSIQEQRRRCHTLDRIGTSSVNSTPGSNHKLRPNLDVQQPIFFGPHGWRGVNAWTAERHLALRA
ncbi:hypothetical protein TNCV_3660191 [Trichonephila clavipes]|nr:hypothetical protein TNCV_3660191 [Trichonephila clavipes]